MNKIFALTHINEYERETTLLAVSESIEKLQAYATQPEFLAVTWTLEDDGLDGEITYTDSGEVLEARLEIREITHL